MSLALIGLDGLSWNIILNYYLKFRCFKRTLNIAKHGLKGINICIPPYTPPSWTSIFTGVNAKKHGIYSFKKVYVENGMLKTRFVTANDINYPRLNELLVMNGFEGMVVNQYFTYPVNSWYNRHQVVVFDDLSPEFIYPDKYKKYLKFFIRPKHVRDRKTLLKKCYEYLFLKIEGIHKLENEVNPDFLIVIFKETDVIMHRLPYIITATLNEDVINIFTILDEFIDNVAKRYRYVSLVSDHGFGIYITRINVLGILSEYGLVSSSRDIISSLVMHILKYRAFGLATYALLISKKGLDIFYKLRSFLRSRMTQARTYKKKDFMLDDVDSDDAFIIFAKDDKTCNRIKLALISYVGSLFENIETIKDGTCKLLIVPKAGLHYMNDYSLSKSTMVHFAAARHSPLGMFIIYGPNIPNTVKILRNTDITPTIMAILKIPLATHFDGKPALENSTITYLNYIKKWKVLKKIIKLSSK